MLYHYLDSSVGFWEAVIFLYITIEGNVVVMMVCAPQDPSLCRFIFFFSSVYLFHLRSTCQLVGVFGGCMFLLSDSVLILDEFLPEGPLFRNYVVLISYYLGLNSNSNSLLFFSLHLKHNFVLGMRLVRHTVSTCRMQPLRRSCQSSLTLNPYSDEMNEHSSYNTLLYCCLSYGHC